jgi:hypothetical protein
MEEAKKRLAILSFILGLFVASVPAQAQTRAGTQVQSASFNGLFDKSVTGGYEGYPAPTQRVDRIVARQRNKFSVVCVITARRWSSRGRIKTPSQPRLYSTARRSANCRFGEFQSCTADASCAPAARARPSAD